MRRLLLGLLLLAVSWRAFPQVVEPANVTPGRAIFYGKATGRLPVWITLNDGVRVKINNDWVYACITDSATGAHWTTGVSLANYRQALATGLWTFSTPRPVTDADRAICWP